MRIEGLTALITGGASGLGKATAQALLDRGARVVLFDLPGSRGAEVAAGWGADARFAPGDVTSEADAQKAVETARDEFGNLRVLVNCAGIGNAARLVGREGPMPLELFTRVINVNLIGTFNVMRLAAAEIMKQEPIDGERGVIVNTASVAAFDGQIGQVPYSASKGGIVGLTLPAARDLSSSLVRVCTIAPGIFETPLLGTLSEEFRQSLAASVPHPHRLGQPPEYAQLALHIIENQMLNGEVIRLDGALRMAPR